jgi:hypothetical protein
MVISGQGAMLMEDPYQRHGPKREELVDQKLMDELKAGEYFLPLASWKSFTAPTIPKLYPLLL